MRACVCACVPIYACVCVCVCICVVRFGMYVCVCTTIYCRDGYSPSLSIYIIYLERDRSPLSLNLNPFDRRPTHLLSKRVSKR